MAEKQSSHRIWVEQLVIANQQRLASRGQVFALVIALFGIGAAAYCGISGATAVGVTIASSALGGLVVAFITGKRAQTKDLRDKRKVGEAEARHE